MTEHSKIVLYVMHADDMLLAHPQTDWTHTCHRCHGPVGLYPSGQRVLQTHKTVTLICNRCGQPEAGIRLAPGALTEPLVSRPVNRRKH